ncbi:hypothetical protein [Treponema sp.]|uniref:hypothetical protein n=1 Tax=Treponema sp. TaxID=166 RepID=UPI00388EDEC5
MKKIVGAVLAASLLAGSAFAADLSFDYTGSGIFGSTTKKVNAVERTDCFALNLQTDIAGVHVDWDIEDEKLALDELYGWLTFGLPVGNLQITSGKWNSRYADRVNTDAGDLGGDYFDAHKLGNIIDNTISLDADNLTEGAMSSVLAYTLADALPGTLMTKVGFVSTADNDAKATKTSYHTVTTNPKTPLFCGFVGEVAYKQEGLANIDLAIKHLTENQTSAGFYVSPLVSETLEATAGFTYGYNTADVTEVAGDLRARLTITEKVALTGMFNYSQVSIKDVDDPYKAMWGMLSVNYTAAENIRFLATLGNTVTDFDAEYGACITNFTPACEIKGSEKVTVTTAVDLRWDNSAAKGIKPFAGTCDISIPVYVHVAL